MRDIPFLIALSALLGSCALAGKGEELQPWQKVLTGDDAKTVETLEKRIDELIDGGNLGEALTDAKEVEAIRVRVQGKDHWEAVDAGWRINALTAVKSRSAVVEYQSLRTAGKDAASLNSQGKYAEAQPLFEKALDLKKKLFGEEHPDTAMGYSNLASSLNSQGKYAKAHPLHEKALALWKKLLSEEHPDTGTGYSNVAFNLNSQGKYADAQPLFEKTVAMRKKLLGEEHLLTAVSYNNLAANLNSQGKQAEAQPHFEMALAMRKKLLGDEHPDTAAGYSNLAVNLNSRGKYAEAQPLFEKALAITEKVLGEEHPDTAYDYNNVAVNLNSQGKYAEAQPLFEKALALRKKLLGDEHPLTAVGYGSLAVNLYTQGKYADAQPLFVKALVLKKAIFGDEHPETAVGYNNLALNLNTQGKYADAQPLFEKALALSRKLLGDEHPNIATVGYNNLALNLGAQGKHAEAQRLFEEALTLSRKLLGDEHPDIATVYTNGGGNLIDQGKYVDAQPLFEKALVLRKKLLGEEHPDTARGYRNLAWDLNAQGKHQEALEHWLLATRSFEAARLRISTSGLGRAEFSAQRNPHPALASALVRDGRSLEAWRYWERGLARGLLDDLSAREARKITPEDQERERKLVGELQVLDARITTSVEPAIKTGAADLEPLRQKRLELQAELSAFDKYLADTYGVAEGKAYEIEKVQAALPEDAALIGWLDVKGHAKAIDRTSEHWAVVVRQKGEPRWVKLPGSGEAEEWSEEDAALGGKLAAELSDRSRLPRPVDGELLAKLTRQRLEPVERILSDDGSPPVQYLIVLPSPDLRDVPVALLAERYTVSYAPSGSVLAWLREKKRPAPAGEAASLLAIGDPAFRERQEKKPEADAAPPEHGAYLAMVVRGSNADQSGLRGGDVLLAYGGERLEGAKDLPGAMEKANAKVETTVTLWRDGNEIDLKVSPGKLGVRLDQRPPREAMEAERELSMVLRGVREGNASYEPLPGTRREVEAIAGKFTGRVEKLLGADASEPKLNELLSSGKLKEYRYLHFATHGVPNRDRAFDSALILAHVPENPEAPPLNREMMDGRLTAAEILRSWSLEAELVVLSACQTAVGQHAGGEGYLGFAQALLLSGARAVLLSLWKVDDTATALLMERFYENLLGARPGAEKGMDKAAALRDAQRWLRKLTRKEAHDLAARLDALAAEKERGNVRPLKPLVPAAGQQADNTGDHPYADPYYWAAFILIGDPG